MVCKRFCNELVTELRIEAGNPGSQLCPRSASAACSASASSACFHTGYSGTQLDFDVAGGHTALARLHSGIFHQLRCKSPVLETMKQLQLQLLLQPYTPVLSVSIFMPGIRQEFAFCTLKRKKNEKDKGKRLFCEREKREKMKGSVIIQFNLLQNIG